MLNQRLVIKAKLHKLGVVNVACTLFGMDKTIEQIFFGNENIQGNFGHGSILKFSSSLL